VCVRVCTLQKRRVSIVKKKIKNKYEVDDLRPFAYGGGKKGKNIGVCTLLQYHTYTTILTYIYTHTHLYNINTHTNTQAISYYVRPVFVLLACGRWRRRLRPRPRLNDNIEVDNICYGVIIIIRAWIVMLGLKGVKQMCRSIYIILFTNKLRMVRTLRTIP